MKTNQSKSTLFHAESSRQLLYCVKHHSKQGVLTTHKITIRRPRSITTNPVWLVSPQGEFLLWHPEREEEKANLPILSDWHWPWAVLRGSQTPILGLIYFYLYKARNPLFFVPPLSPLSFHPIPASCRPLDSPTVLLTLCPKQASTTISFGEWLDLLLAYVWHRAILYWWQTCC